MMKIKAGDDALCALCQRGGTAMEDQEINTSDVVGALCMQCALTVTCRIVEDLAGKTEAFSLAAMGALRYGVLPHMQEKTG